MKFSHRFRMLHLAGAMSLLRAAGSSAAAYSSAVPVGGAESRYLSGEAASGSAAVMQAVTPAYKAIEGVSDAVYNALRWNLFDAVLPPAMSRTFVEPPAGDSAAQMYFHLREKEGLFLQRMRETLFIDGAGGPAFNGDARQAAAQAVQRQADLLAGSLRDTFIERYDLINRAQDMSNWDPGIFAFAGALGGALMYYNGAHLSGQIGQVKVRVDLCSVAKIREAVHPALALKSLGAFELGVRKYGVTLAVDFGVRAGNLLAQRVALNYRLRY